MDFEVLIFYFACNTQILRHWEGGAKTVGVFLAVRKQYVSINSNRSDILLANECFFLQGRKLGLQYACILCHSYMHLHPCNFTPFYLMQLLGMLYEAPSLAHVAPWQVLYSPLFGRLSSLARLMQLLFQHMQLLGRVFMYPPFQHLQLLCKPPFPHTQLLGKFYVALFSANLAPWKQIFMELLRTLNTAHCRRSSLARVIQLLGRRFLFGPSNPHISRKNSLDQ